MTRLTSATVVVGILVTIAAVWDWNRAVPATPSRWSWTAPAADKPAALSGSRPELVLQTGHLDRVVSVAFSPDSKLVASSSDDGTVKLWDVASRRELRSFAAPDTPTVEFSVDGQWVMGEGDRFHAWSVATGKSTDTDLQPKWTAGSANGQWRAVESDGGTLVSQDAKSGGAIHELPLTRSGTNRRPHFSPNDRWLAVEEVDERGSDADTADLSKMRTGVLNDSVETTIQLWEIGTWRALATIPGRRPVNTAPVFSADGRWLAVIGDGRRHVELWEVARGQKARVLETRMPVSVVAFSPDSRLVLAGADRHIEVMTSLGPLSEPGREGHTDPNTSLLLWDLATEGAPRTIAAGAGIWSLAFSPDGRKLAAAGPKGVTYWDPRDASVPPVRIDAGECASVAFSADNKQITWATGRDVKVRDLLSGGNDVLMAAPVMPVNLAALSPDGRWLATTNADDRTTGISGRVRLWDIGTGREAHTLASDPTSLKSLVFSQDSRHLMTIGDQVVAWDPSSGQTAAPPNDLPDPLPFVLTSDDGKTIASGPDPQGHLFIQTPDSNDRHKISASGPVEHMGLSRDGRWLTASGCKYMRTGMPSDCSMRVWDTSTRKKVQTWSQTGSSLATSSDGRRLAAAGSAGGPGVQVWDIASGAQELSVGRHSSGNTGIVNATAFSLDSRRVAFSDDIHTIQIWDVASRQQIASLVGHTSIVGRIVFMADGRILSTSFDGTIRLWDAAAGELLITMVFLTDRQQWLAVTPSGLFDGSSDAWSRLLWRFNKNTFDVAPVDTFFNEFYYPGLLGEIFAGQRPAPPRDIALLDRRQPTIRLSAAPIDTRMTRLRIAIDEIAAKDSHPSGAQDVRLFRNGSLVRAWRGDVLTAGKRHVILHADVPIAAGPNRFTAYAFNRDNVKSADATLTLTGTDAPRKGTAYVITIGVNEYANPTFNLKFAVADARRFGEEFAAEQERIGRFERVQVVSLLDKDATKDNILRTLNRLAGVSDLLTPTGPALEPLPAADPEDAVFIFFAGHGVTEGERFSLVPHDLGFTGAREALDAGGVHEIASRGISDQDLGRALESVDAAQLLLVIDACNSGQALESAERRQGPINSKGLAQLAYEKGMYVLTAAQSYQAAMETERLGHGLLTYALVEAGLAAREADVAPKDGSILMREWLDFAAAKVPTLQLDLLQGARSAKLVGVIGQTSVAPERSNVQRPRVFYRRELDLQPLVIARR